MDSAKERIMNSARSLFYKNGYTETGINEILKDSGTFKKSFYVHFSSKTELGTLYVQEIEATLLNLCQRILTKHSNFKDFSHAWINLSKKRLSKMYPMGCPLTNLPINSEEIRNQNKIAFENLKKPFIDYFQRNYNLSEQSAKQWSEKILMLYEGSMNSYKLDPNPKYFDYMEEFLNIVYERLKAKTE